VGGRFAHDDQYVDVTVRAQAAEGGGAVEVDADEAGAEGVVEQGKEGASGACM
jgi:hypothetical protein